MFIRVRIGKEYKEVRINKYDNIEEYDAFLDDFKPYVCESKYEEAKIREAWEMKHNNMLSDEDL